MQNATLQCPENEPLEFQNRSTYRDLLRLLSMIRDFQKNAQTDLSQKFLRDFVYTVSFLAKEVAYLSLNESNEPFKKKLLAVSILKTFDCMASLSICFEARWIPATAYFEAKQILEKIYWSFKNEQETMGEAMQFMMENLLPQPTAH